MNDRGSGTLATQALQGRRRRSGLEEMAVLGSQGSMPLQASSKPTRRTSPGSTGNTTDEDRPAHIKTRMLHDHHGSVDCIELTAQPAFRPTLKPQRRAAALNTLGNVQQKVHTGVFC